jgi:hypothetical protein
MVDLGCLIRPFVLHNAAAIAENQARPALPVTMLRQTEARLFVETAVMPCNVFLTGVSHSFCITRL